MWIPLGLLMKEHCQFPCFGWTLKVCIVFIVLTSTTSLACWGGGGGGGAAPTTTTTTTTTPLPPTPEPDDWEDFLSKNENDTMTVPDIDEKLVVNLTGIKDPLERNIKTAFNGWDPSDETKKDWKKWYENWKLENEKNGEGPWNKKKGKGDDGGDGSGGPGGQDFSHERGPGSGWPDSPDWADLGVGNGGSPVPPWGFVPKNIGKPSLCYQPPIEGICKTLEERKESKPGPRWGYNPYTDECQEYGWSGCGGTRNKFLSKDKCEQHCMTPTPPTCAVDSGIRDKSKS